MKTFAPPLSGIRTLLFGALAIVWFSEMILWGFFSEVWKNVWNIASPGNPQLTTALSIILATQAPAKGALGVLAVFGLRSRNPSARTGLFLSMALVPPLNIAFQFRAQGFPLKSVAVATVFSLILWGSFFLFREPTQQSGKKGTEGAGQLPPSRWETLQYAWFAVYSTALTLMAFLFQFAPRTALSFIFPCLSPLLSAPTDGISGLIFGSLTNGTHLTALATASWIATIYCRSNPTLRQALTVANTLHAGLLVLLPLRRIALGFGGSCATSSILVLVVPLFVGWVLYAAVDATRIRPLAGSRTR